MFNLIYEHVISFISLVKFIIKCKYHWNCIWCNPFWDSKPELFSDIACLRIPYQPCSSIQEFFFRYPCLEPVWITLAPQCRANRRWSIQKLARHWGAGVIHASSRQGYFKIFFRIELCMVDKGFWGRQYQKTTLASNPKKCKPYPKKGHPIWQFGLSALARA